MAPSPTSTPLTKSRNQTKASENRAKDSSRLIAPPRDFWFDTSMYAMVSSGPHGQPSATSPFTAHAEGLAAGASFLTVLSSSNQFDVLPPTRILEEDDEAQGAGTRVSRKCWGAGTHTEGAKQDSGVGFHSIARSNPTSASLARSLFLASEKAEIT
jgi:hypothetical protein